MNLTGYTCWSRLLPLQTATSHLRKLDVVPLPLLPPMQAKRGTISCFPIHQVPDVDVQGAGATHDWGFLGLPATCLAVLGYLISAGSRH